MLYEIYVEGREEIVPINNGLLRRRVPIYFIRVVVI